MRNDDNKENLFAAMFGVIGTLSIILSLGFKGLTLENILDAVKDIAGFIVGIAVFLVAVTLNRKSRTYLDIAETALSKLQRGSNGNLEGPKFNSDDYVPGGLEKTDDPEKNDDPEKKLPDSKSKRMQYLFLSTRARGKKVPFIPLAPLAEGILDIQVSKSTLLTLGYEPNPAKDPLLEEIAIVQSDVSRIVKLIVDKYEEDCQIVYSKDPPISEASSTLSKYARSAIVIDFDEKALGPRKFEKFIIECGDAALKTILKYKKVKTS